MVRRTTPTVWVYDNSGALLAVAAALALGVLIGIGVKEIDGKFAAMQVVGSVLGAGLGVAGGVFVGLMIQRRKFDDDRLPDAVVNLFALQQLEGYLKEKDIDDISSLNSTIFAWLMSKRLTELKPSPRLGLELTKLMHAIHSQAEMLVGAMEDWNERAEKSAEGIWPTAIGWMKRDVPTALAGLKAIARA